MHRAQRSKTYDREATPILVHESIGPRRARTADGYLLCYDVPIARVGDMLYGAGEVPLRPGRDGMIRVSRDSGALLNPTTIASFSGKPVTLGHPPNDWLGPKNWKKYSCGVTLNPRIGEGENRDCIVADLLITDQAAISAVEADMREVSAGYDSAYTQTRDGEGTQTNIIGNHIALVERGRCGPRCAIGDHSPTYQEHNTMPQPRVSLDDSAEGRVRKIFTDAQEAALSAIGSSGEQAVHVHVHTGDRSTRAEPEGDEEPAKAATIDAATDARLKGLEEGQKATTDALTKLADAVTKLAGAGAPPTSPVGSDDIKTTDGMPDEVAAAMRASVGDSAALETSFKAVTADAEILVPGYQLPNFDAKAPRKATMDSMCGLRRGILGHLTSTGDGQKFLASVAGGQDLKALGSATCYEVASLYRAAAGAKRAINQSATTRDGSRVPLPTRTGNGPGPALATGPRSIADLNALHAKMFPGSAAQH